ncbi:MAG: hypothetical protein WEC59_04550 [Salibacteraceae bacterium]
MTTIAPLSLIGTFKKEDSTYYALYDRLIGQVVYFNKSTNRMNYTFTIPKNDTVKFPAMVSVIDWNKILYFNSENQSLVLTTTHEVKSEKLLKIKSNQIEWKIINTYLNLQFNKDRTSLLFSLWVDYSNESNPDSLMDERYLFVEIDTHTLAYNFIPFKPKFKRFNKSNQRIYDIKPFVLQDTISRYVGFNSFLEDILIYENQKKHATQIKGTDYPVEVMYLPRNYTQEDILKEIEGKVAHRLFYSSKHDVFIRRIKKWEKEDERQTNVYIVELLNNQFEVKKVFDFEKQLPSFYMSGDNIFLKLFDRPSQTMTLYEFTI